MFSVATIFRQVINSFRTLLSKQSTVDGEDKRLLEQLVNRRKVLLTKKQKVPKVVMILFNLIFYISFTIKIKQ